MQKEVKKREKKWQHCKSIGKLDNDEDNLKNICTRLSIGIDKDLLLSPKNG